MTGLMVTVSWRRPDISPRGLWITDPAGGESGAGEPVADAQLLGVGAPTTGQCDQLLETLGFTREGPWADDVTGLHAWVVPIRPPSGH